jgi:septum formation protein
VTPEIEELEAGAPAEDLVIENARRKARAGAGLAAAENGALVVGVDTEVVLDGKTLGKASTTDEARARLKALSGRTHTVLSGVVVAEVGGGERSGVARSEVTFAELSEEMLELYLSSGEWCDRAGAYAIQGLGAFLVDRMEGDFSNVVGLPLRLLSGMVPAVLQKFKAEV